MNDLDAANKEYVDNTVTGAVTGNYLPLGGGTMKSGAVIGKTDTLRVGQLPGDGAGLFLSETTGASLYNGDQTISATANSKGASSSLKQSLMLCKVDNENAVHCDGMRVVAVGDPVADGDAVNKKYVDDHSGGGDYLPLSGGTMRGDINMASNDIFRANVITYANTSAVGSNPRINFNSSRVAISASANEDIAATADGVEIHNLVEPTADSDAATKAYVDENAGGDVKLVKEPGVSVAYAGFFACPGLGTVDICNITGTMAIYASCAIQGQQRSDVHVLTENISAGFNASDGVFRVSVTSAGLVQLDCMAPENQPFAGFVIIWR